MKKQSLQDVMNDLARGVPGGTAGSALLPQGGAGEMAGVEAWLGADPVLAGLYKILLDSQAAQERVVRTQGTCSAMAETAGGLVDSARRAVETRLAELRRAGGLTREERMALHAGNMREAALRARRAAEDRLFLFFMLWIFLRGLVRDAQERLSASTAFAAASRDAASVRAAA